MNLPRSMQRLRHEIGIVGIVSLALIVCAIAFQFSVLRPLEVRRDSLEQGISQRSPGGSQSDASQGLAPFYRFFESADDVPTQLARLQLIGKAAGLDLRSAQYKADKSSGRILRYEMTLPITGSYAQIRSFLANALAEMPVLSLDQVSLKKDHAGDGPVHADVRMTLHLLQP